MKFIFGLGNIGKQYDQTRHNIGFMALDHFADSQGVSFAPTKLFASAAKLQIDGETVWLVKPTTYMNDSGQSVRAFLDFYGATAKDILVLHDDLDSDFGKLRFRAKGSAGGHNGLKSIIAHTGTQDFLRLKFGIAHPEHTHEAVIKYVLGKFSKDDLAHWDETFEKTDQALLDWIKGADAAALSNRYNG
ncbi:aminoacyl-tRNA hydrolase [Fructobacillus papyrifericola]|uniref:Peptidyl-tRNA hydrolase n=1 Tax=Fructobacillus papyrifericola TaxID=2713172 RepID=A0ABS5QUG5_9LACO|nr:aminoacyl-tRNA hydrolase [Fructobacillus papyrifericola]MBS9336828.1 aminoacyl-tRNA hydrolase [Fructobacillus papyrifericola]